MPRPIEDLADDQLSRFIKNYEAQEKTTGGIYPLSDLLVEKLRRTPTARSPHEVFRFVVEKARNSPDGQTTYQEVWNFLRPAEPWKGNYSIKVVGGTLGAVIAYSIRNSLPIVSTLVVQSGKRRLSDRAVQAIYDDCKRYGLEVGLAPADFVVRETELARSLNLADLP